MLGALLTAGGAAAQLGGSSSVLPGTRPSVFATIQGNAMNASNSALSSSVVRLRDARLGRIVKVGTTDTSGVFAFRTIDPGIYVVEIVNQNAAVVATSQVLNVNASEVVTTIVKMPFRIRPFAGLLGQTTQIAASEAVVAAAASTGVLTSGPLDVCVSGPCD